MAKDNKKITLESLAQMVKRGFDATATKSELKTLDAKLTNITSDVVVLKSQMQEVARRLARLESIIEKAFIKLDKFLTQLTKLDQEYVMVKADLKEVRKRLEKIEAHLGIVGIES